MNFADMLLVSNSLRSAALEWIVPPDLDPRISPGELRVTDFLIDQNEPVRVRDIVDHCQLAQSRASTVVQTLQKRGWVEISTNPDDRRTTTVKIKPEVAKPARELLTSNAQNAFEKLLESISTEERETIEKGLQCFADVLRRKGKLKPYSVQ
ncbi:MarR family transcriptional regulator [Pelagicoccus sp. SDUM812003]|uniref:MarR family winged helix-turn-helix transcriptional regulator n=1 Tax=Pelagicoccus sp. SDUM812003 TaxID=3041267 RepID=UPI00280C86B8|nr:MarR family transcriptional regulator [Pelagicoccus sp. SDUM812003]MDQ8203485.1 MarR family transcriptional regulator [Pelagicoccus sp. SDUM812003]